MCGELSSECGAICLLKASLIWGELSWNESCLNLNLNLNSLLVKRQIDNPSPGAVTGEISP